MHARTRTGELQVESERGQHFARIEDVDALTFRAHGPHGETLMMPCAFPGCDVQLVRRASERDRVQMHFCDAHQYSEEAVALAGTGKRGPDKSPTARQNRSGAMVKAWEPGGPYDQPTADGGPTVREQIAALGTEHAASYNPQGSRVDVPPAEATRTYAERLDRAQQAGHGPDWRPSAAEGRKRQAAAMVRGPDGRFVSTRASSPDRGPVDREQLILALDAQARGRAQKKATRAIGPAVRAALLDDEDQRTDLELAADVATSERYVRQKRAELVREGLLQRRPPGRPPKVTA
jgi:hypothetical protein